MAFEQMWAEKPEWPSWEAYEEWARTRPVLTPVRWGDVETAIFERRHPPVHEKVTVFGVVMTAVQWLFLAPLVLLTFGSSLLALVLVLVAVGSDDAAGAGGWLSFARLALVMAIGVVVLQRKLLQSQSARSSKGMWLSAFGIMGLTMVCSAAIVALLVMALSEVGGAWVTAALASVAFVAGVVVLVLGLRMETPRFGYESPFPASSRDVMRAEHAKRLMLDILVERGLVDLSDERRIAILEMDCGTWNELDVKSERPRDA